MTLFGSLDFSNVVLHTCGKLPFVKNIDFRVTTYTENYFLGVFVDETTSDVCYEELIANDYTVKDNKITCMFR